MNYISRDWIAFSYITNNTFLGREDIDLGLAGNRHHLILYNLGKTFYIHYHLTPFQWHTICLIWDGVKGRLELFLNKERLLVMMDQPQNLTPNGTLVIGHFPKNGRGRLNLMPRFTGSLYYFQMWDHILENKDFLKCLDGNVVSWEEDDWLVNKIIPTVDRRLRCFVSDNIAIQGTSTTLSQQIDYLTTPYQITGLKPQWTLYSSTVMSESIPVFATDFTTILYSNKTSPPLETMIASKYVKPSMAETSTLAADIISTSPAIILPTKNTSIITNNNFMKTNKPLSSPRTMTTKTVEAIASETFHPTAANTFLYTSGFTENSVVSKTSATRSQSDITKTSLFSFAGSTSVSPTSWPNPKATENGKFPVSTVGQVFHASSAGTVPSSPVEQTSASTSHIGAASVFPPQSELISTAIPVDSVFPRNQTASMSATTDVEIVFTVPSVTLPTRSVETMPVLRTAEIELTSTNIQDVSSFRTEDDILTSMPKDASSVPSSSRTSSSFIRAQSIQTVTNTDTVVTALTTGITLAPIVTDLILSSTTAGPVYTQTMPTTGKNMLSLSSTRPVSTAKSSESSPTTITDETSYLFSTNKTAWTSRPDQNPFPSIYTSNMPTFMPIEEFTSALHRDTSNKAHSSSTTNIITLPETATESESTSTGEAFTTETRFTTAVPTLVSLWFANFSTVFGTTSGPKPSEFKSTALLQKSTPMSTVAPNALLSTLREATVPPEDRKSTLADIESVFSTKERFSETTQIETNGTLVSVETTGLVPKSVTTQISVETRKATDAPSQMVTASTTISPFPNIENSTFPVDNKTVSTDVINWFMTESLKTTPDDLNFYNGSTEIFNSTHNYTVHWTSETPSEGNLAPSPTSGRTQTFPELLDVSTTGVFRTIFTTPSTDRTAMSSSTSTLPLQPISTHFPAASGPVTHMVSLPASGSVVVSDVIKVTVPEPPTPAKAFSASVLSDISTLPSATETTTSVTTVDQTSSMTSNSRPTHRDSDLTTSEATLISVRMTPMTVPSVVETPGSSLRTPIPTKIDTSLPFISSERVTPCTHTLTPSTYLFNTIPVVSSTHVTMAASIPVATQSTSQVAEAPVLETSTHAVSLPYHLSGGTEVLSLVTGTTETSIVDEILTSHTSANKLTTLVDIHSFQSSTHLVSTPAPTPLVTSTPIVSSNNEQMVTSLGNTPRTMKATEMFSSKNSFISYSPDTSSLEMTERGFSETMPEENSATSPTSRSTQTTHALTSDNTVGTQISEESTDLGQTTISHALTITTLSPERESMSAMSEVTPRSVEMIIRSTSVTQPVSYYKETSFIDTEPFKTTRLSSPINTNTIVSHVPSLRTQPMVTSLSSSTSESTMTSHEPLSFSTSGLSNKNFTVISTDKVTTTFFVPNVYTPLEKTSMVTPIPISPTSSLPFNVTVFTSRKVSDTPTIPMTESSKTIPSGCLKGSSVATSGPMSEISSLPVKDSIFSTSVVSSDTSTTAESFSTLSSSVNPRTTMTIEISTLDAISETLSEPTAKGTIVSSAFTTSEMTTMSSGTTRTLSPSLKDSAFPSVKTFPTTVIAGKMTPSIGTSLFSLLSSKNTEAVSSTPSKNTEAVSSTPTTTFSSILLTTQQPSQVGVATTLGLIPGITQSSLSTMSSGSETALTNIYSRTIVPGSVPLLTSSDNPHTSINIQVSPSLTSFNSTLKPTKQVNTTTYLSSNTRKVTALSENTSLTDELKASATSVTTPISYLPLTSSTATPLSLTSFLYLPHSTETEFLTTKTSTVPTSHMVEFPVLGTAITSSISQSSWNTPIATEPHFLISTTAYVPTPNKMETATLQLVPESLSTFSTSETDLVSEDATSKSSVPTPEILPTVDLSESLTSSTSPRTILTTLADSKQTVEKTTFVIPGITLTSKSVSATGATTLKATTQSMLTLSSSSLSSDSPLATIPKAHQPTVSSTVEESKSTFPTTDMIPTYPFTNFTPPPLATLGTILTKTTPTSALASITTGFQTSLPISIKTTGDNVYSFTSPEATPRTTMIANSRTMSQLPSYSRVNMSPPANDHTLSIGLKPLSSSTGTSSRSSIPAVPTIPTLVFSKPKLDSLPNITITSASTATGSSFPLVSNGVTHPFTAIASSLISSSFETTTLDSTPSFLSRGTLTSAMAAECAVSFYNIEMNFSVFDGESRIPITSVINEFAEYWLNSIFQDSEFVLANLATQIKSRDTSKEEITMDRAIWEPREGQETTIPRVPYSCVCQVIIKANSSLASTELIDKIKSKIHGNLTHGNFTQDQLTLLVKSEHVAVKKLEPGKCKADKTASKFKGTYKWLLTNPTEIAQTRCIKNEDGNATRICSININTGKSQWEKPKFKQCKLLQDLPDKIVDLANITINDENANDVAEHILNLINESPPLDDEETKIIVSKVSDISKCDEISMNLTQVILQIISAVWEKQSNLASELNEVSNEILRIIDRAGHKMEFSGRTANLTVARLALTVLRVDHTFEGMAFGIRSYEEGTDPEIYLGQVPLGKTVASIYLPKSLREKIPLNNLHTILFNFFGQTSLFKTKTFTKALTTYVVSASISDMSIQNLADPVVITLQHIEGNQNFDKVHCAFWDFDINNGLGGWNSSGCKVNETNINYTICHCDHLTHFGVLMDLSRSTVDAVNERILVLITYTGCGISSIFLGVAIVTYIAFHKLRKDYPSKILVNLCTALLMLNMAFLVNSWSASFQKEELCITAAVALHYFLLVSLTWMGLEAVHMYFALIKVFNIYIPNYIFKFCLAGWGIPAILVAIILSVKKDLYGTLNPVTPFCWIKDDSIFYISVVAYFCLVFILNLFMFCAVLAQLNSMKGQRQKSWRKMILHDVKGTTSLTFLLGLTWGFAFFAWGPVRILFLYLFAIFNTMQGFLIFVFHCAMKENVRDQWQMHLCCRWFRLDNSSDASSRYGMNVGYMQEGLKKTFEHKLLTLSFESTATNSTLKSLGSTQGFPSDIIFPNDDIDDDPYCISPLSGETVPNCVRRILPVEMKMNSIQKQSYCQEIPAEMPSPPPQIG
ncbi:PREDICTED: probable G-protein coupled receptor 112 [Elephantulus edwardii]|uniref:probable G-protein coupled receptor 112 n=1 Tax=Elephantulus edwardii TaxID=28737 RepID=UPI0003F0DD52|nr:PREDICTED: probable G-protein coupled receptor 112 [Elephantulus edwardii]